MHEPGEQDELENEYLSPEDEAELLRRCDEDDTHPEDAIPHHEVVPPRAKLAG
jgi:hypothetical protein